MPSIRYRPDVAWSRQPMMSTGGFVEVTPLQGALAAGQQVVVGYKNEPAKEGQ